MNREILFRGKRIDNGEWIEGFYCKFRNGLSGKYVPHIQVLFGENGHGMYAVDPLTVGQFTGSLDKNGKKIFEGDICNWKSTAYSNIVPYVANYSDSDCRFVLRGKVDTIPMWDGLEIEVIGTIHDKTKESA